MAKKRKIDRSRRPRRDGKASRWSAKVTRSSDALDLERNVFSKQKPD